MFFATMYTAEVLRVCFRALGGFRVPARRPPPPRAARSPPAAARRRPLPAARRRPSARLFALSNGYTGEETLI